MNQAYAVAGIAALGFLGLASANFLYDRGVQRALSRYAAPLLGGAAFLTGVLWLHAWIAIGLSAAMSAAIVALRLGFRSGLRGVKGTLPGQAWAEITYPVAGTASLIVGWGILGDRWLAFVPIAFMAWGDAAAGLARASIWRGNKASIGPSIAMLGVCLAAAALFQPFWIGGVGAVAAPLAERFRPTRLTVWDDNFNVVFASLAVMSGLAAIASIRNTVELGI